MESRTLQFLAECCGGKIRHLPPDTIVRNISTDSRTVQSDDLFVAVPGDNFDGHNFVADVLARGGLGAMVRTGSDPSIPGIEVSNTRAALGQIGAGYRRTFDIKAIAIAGSNGKTTTKELVASVLRQKLSTLASAGSFNNDMGVPLTLLQLKAGHRAGVFEAGTNHPGELRPLLDMIQPSLGIITNIGREHLEHFQDLDGVLREEGQLAEVLPPGGLLVMHGDGYGSDVLRQRTRARVARVGTGPGNDWRISKTHFDAQGTHFILDAPDSAYTGEYSLKILGTHQALNASQAIVIGAELGLSRVEIQAGLAACAGAKMRLQLRRINDFQVLDDAYNANADSMDAALETLGHFPCAGRRIAVLGDMAELGSTSAPAHEEVGRGAARRKIDFLIAVGTHASLVADAARSAGLRDVVVTPGAEQAGLAVRDIVRSGDVILVKASRSSRLERVVEFLSANFGVK